MILFSVLMHLATFAGVVGLAVWAWRHGRAGRANRRGSHSRAASRSREISRRYLDGVKARAAERPPLRAVD